MKEYIIGENIWIGEGSTIDVNVVIGKLPRGIKEGELETIIGDNVNLGVGTIIYAGARIGDNFRSGDYAVIREYVEIDDDSIVGTHCLVLPYARIGNRVTVHSLCEIAEYSNIMDGSWLGPGVILLNTKHPKANVYSDKERSDREGAPVIERNVRVGGNATINSFVKIGENSIVGAGAVVVKDVPKGKVVVGNPARVIKDISELRDVFNRNIKPYN